MPRQLQCKEQGRARGVAGRATADILYPSAENQHLSPMIEQLRSAEALGSGAFGCMRACVCVCVCVCLQADVAWPTGPAPYSSSCGAHPGPHAAHVPRTSSKVTCGMKPSSRPPGPQSPHPFALPPPPPISASGIPVRSWTSWS